jgi:hypothetical protein
VFAFGGERLALLGGTLLQLRVHQGCSHPGAAVGRRR